MDQMAARELSKETQLASLELGIESNAMLGSCDGGASCAYTNTIAWRTPTTPLPIENDPRAVFERLFGTTGSTDPAARLARLRRRPHHPGPRRRGARRPRARHRPGRPGEAGRVPRVRARHRAAHRDGRAAERPRAARGRPARRRPERLRGARQADDGPAGARLPDRPDAHQHVHAGAGGVRTRVPGDRRARLAPPAVAPPGRAGPSWSGCTRSTSTTSSSSPTSSGRCPRRRKATG